MKIENHKFRITLQALTPKSTNLDYLNACQDKTDTELVELAIKDPEYFGCLMLRYQKKLFAFMRRTSFFKKEEIEDILQEVFIKVYKNLNEYDTSLKFSSWIYRIARNQTIDEIRKNKRHAQALSLEANDLGKFIRSSVNIEKSFDQKESLKKARQAIQDLPQKYRDVLILRFLEEKNYTEIMDILKKPKGTVATLIKRGREMMKEKIHQ